MVLLRKTFGPKRNEITGEWKNLKMRSFVVVLTYLLHGTESFLRS